MQVQAFQRVFEEYTDSISDVIHITFSFDGNYEIAVGRGESKNVVPLTFHELNVLYQSIGDHIDRHSFRDQLMDDMVQYALSVPTIEGLCGFLREVHQVEGIPLEEIGERIKERSPAFIGDLIDTLVTDLKNQQEATPVK